MTLTAIPPILDVDRYVAYSPVVLTTDFAFKAAAAADGFPFFGDAGDLKVYVNGVVITSGYSVLSTAYGAIANAVMPVTDAFVRLDTGVTGVTVEIYGATRPRRVVQATAAFNTRAFNYAFSYLTSAIREMWSQFSRAIQVPVGESPIVLPSAASRAQKVLGFDSSGNPLAVDPMTGGVVGSGSILDGAVTTPKILDGVVTSAKLAASLLDGTAGSLIRWAAGPKYPAGDGSLITNVVATPPSSVASGATGTTPAQTDVSTKLATTAHVAANRGWDVVAEDRKSSGTAGGSAVIGWQTRVLNTLVDNTISASLSSNQITLAAGTYEVEADAPAYAVNYMQLRLYNVTDSSVIDNGTSEYNGSSNAQYKCFVRSKFTLAATKIIRLEQYANTAAATTGLGTPVGQAVEIYARVRIKRLL